MIIETKYSIGDKVIFLLPPAYSQELDCPERTSAAVEIMEFNVEVDSDYNVSVVYGGAEKDRGYHWRDEMNVVPMPATKDKEFAMRLEHEFPGGFNDFEIDQILKLVKSIYGVTIDENSNDV